MDDIMYDFPYTINFVEPDDTIPSCIPHTEKFNSHLKSDLYNHLLKHGMQRYSYLPRVINQYNYISIFKKFIDCENKAGIVYISYKPNRTWVHMSLCISSQNNYYAVTYIIDENMESLTDKQLYNRTLSLGKIANIVRYKLKEYKSKL